MATNAPIRCRHLEGKAWTAVDNSTGQDISFDCPTKELMISVFATTTNTLEDYFTVTPYSRNYDETDAVRVTQNPWIVSIASDPDTILFNIKAATATNVDIDVVILH